MIARYAVSCSTIGAEYSGYGLEGRLQTLRRKHGGGFATGPWAGANDGAAESNAVGTSFSSAAASFEDMAGGRLGRGGRSAGRCGSGGRVDTAYRWFVNGFLDNFDDAFVHGRTDGGCASEVVRHVQIGRSRRAN